MSFLRLQERVSSAVRIGTFFLDEHQLRFHMKSKDGSGKCDAYHTKNKNDVIIGALFDIHESEKQHLDKAESLGVGYNEKIVFVRSKQGDIVEALTYFAIKIDHSLKPYPWYLNHVITGAIEINVSPQYLDFIQTIECIEDPDKNRSRNQHAIYR
jgi:hypothetical protein